MQKIRLLAVIWITFWLSLNALPALASSHETLAGDIDKAFSGRTPFPMPSMKIKHLTVDQAYDIQAGVVKIMQSRGETVMGYKAGLTAVPAQKKFGVSEAVRGTLFKSMLRWPGTLYKENYPKSNRSHGTGS